MAGVKAHWIETFLISLKSYWNEDVWNGLVWPIWTFETQVMAKRKVGSQISSLILDHQKLGITLISSCPSGVRHIVGKFLTRATTLLQTSSQSKICTQRYGPPKSRESQLWEFRDSHLGISGQNAIWMLVPSPTTKYTIRGKVMVSPKFGSWWMLWVWICPWFVLTPKVF